MKIFLAFLLTGVTLFSSPSAQAKSGFCSRVNELNKAASSLGTDVKTFNALSKKIKDSTSSAPSAIRADWKTLSDGFEKLNSLVGQVKKKGNAANSQKIQAEMQKVSNDPKLKVANDKITAWALKECGIDLNK